MAARKKEETETVTEPQVASLEGETPTDLPPPPTYSGFIDSPEGVKLLLENLMPLFSRALPSRQRGKLGVVEDFAQAMLVGMRRIPSEAEVKQAAGSAWALATELERLDREEDERLAAQSEAGTSAS